MRSEGDRSLSEASFDALGRGIEPRLHLVPQAAFGRLDGVGDDTLDVREQNLAMELRENRK